MKRDFRVYARERSSLMPALSQIRPASLIFCLASAAFSQTLSFNRTDIPLGADVQDVIAADFNGDGKIDLAVALYNGSIAVLLGNGDGTFSAPMMTTSIAAPGQVVAAFVNTDDKLDLVVGTSGSCPEGHVCPFAQDLGTYTILIGNGDGTFTYDGTYPVPTYSRLAVGAFTGPGQPVDVFTTGQNDTPGVTNAACLTGEGNGMFSGSTPLGAGGLGTPFVGDFNNDGLPDVAVGSLLFLGQGHCMFQAQTVLQNRGPSFFNQDAAADLNGDGNLDLVVFDNGESGPNATVLLGNGDGTFQIPAKTVPTVTNAAGGPLVDVNGDGKADLVYISFVPTSVGSGEYANADTVSVVLGNGDGTFSTGYSFPTGSNPRKVIAADVNGDGLMDLITANQDGQSVTILLNSGTVPLTNVSGASFQALPELATASIVTALGADLAVGAMAATSLPLPTKLNGTTVTIKDSSGASALAPLFYVSGKQVNYEIPAGTALGAASITILSGDGNSSSQSIQIGTVSPGVFELNPGGLVAADVVTVAPDGSQTASNVYQLDPSNKVVPLPVDVSSGQTYLELYATGVRNASVVQATVAGGSVPVLAFEAQSQFAGLDQINIGPLPRGLEGLGSVNIIVVADGKTANTVNVTIQ